MKETIKMVLAFEVCAVNCLKDFIEKIDFSDSFESNQTSALSQILNRSNFSASTFLFASRLTFSKSHRGPMFFVASLAYRCITSITRWKPGSPLSSNLHICIWSFWITARSTSWIIEKTDSSSTINSHRPPRSVGLSSWKKNIWKERLSWMNWRSIFWRVLLLDLNLLINWILSLVRSFDRAARQIICNRERQLLTFNPLCEVPKKSISYIEINIDRRCSVFMLFISEK